MSNDITAIAETIYERFCSGFANGDWDAFFAYVEDELPVAWPAEPGAGSYAGAEGRQFLEQQLRFFGGEHRITDITRTATTVAGDTVFFEDISRGEIFGAPYHARHCVILTIRNNKVAGFREYIAQQPADS
jgi:ketosteroid isomerase-like protein